MTNPWIEILKAATRAKVRQERELLGMTIFKEALFHFGEGHQVLKAIEELNELSVELARFKICPDNVMECTDEIADCYIMLAQLKEVFGADKVDRRIEEKTERLRRLITE